jgi:hypothetical protein
LPASFPGAATETAIYPTTHVYLRTFIKAIEKFYNSPPDTAQGPPALIRKAI